VIDLRSVTADVVIGTNVSVRAERVQIGRGVTFGDDVRIRANALTIGDDVRIGDGVVIDCDRLTLGWGAVLEKGCRLAAMNGAAKSIVIGDQTLLGHDSKILVPHAAIGDYTTIHNHSLLNGYAPMVIGHNNWIGQSCILNSEAPLTMGNHVGIGAYSCVYTHGYFGDLLEGSQIFNVAPVTIEDDAWILGSYNIVSPGVTIGAKALVLTGSNVTKSVPPNHTVGGAPARDMTERLVPYVEVSLDAKMERMRTYVSEFDAARPNVATFQFGLSSSIDSPRPLIVIAREADAAPASDVTVFDLSRRRYFRTRSNAEAAFIRFLRSYRARFVPADHPRVTFEEEP
jgi:acetyltransferase-like isoleucine patch superfamily enzyme